jgi:hypothetical protein
MESGGMFRPLSIKYAIWTGVAGRFGSSAVFDVPPGTDFPLASSMENG